MAAHRPGLRADHDQILAAKRAVAVAPGLDGNAVIEQHRNFVSEIVAALVSETVTRAPCCLQKKG